MGKILEKRLESISTSEKPNIFCGGIKGIEKESLRVTKDGDLSLSSHPDKLGSALTNKFITTDFSEALLEFVTPAFSNTWEVMSLLCDIHQFTYDHIDEEFLWVASMPCRLNRNNEIPLARYGASNVGTMKTIYRNGLGLRYGRKMQAIAGIHFNYSLPNDFWPVFQDIEKNNDQLTSFRSASYMSMIRNVKRYGWLILYLFGASPAICKSFIEENSLDMPLLDDNTFYQPYGTSLRMSDLGYTSTVQSNINISLNNLDHYIRDLKAAISAPEDSYAEFGLRKNNAYQQLSLNKLQIENEYYSPVRPKRVAASGERPTTALDRGGVEYVEIRSLDLNVFDPVGISQETMRFVETFLIFCLLEDSPLIDKSTSKESMENHTNTANYGRKPNFSLTLEKKEITLKDWALDLMKGILQVAYSIDQEKNCSGYVRAVEAQIELIKDPERTPSARLLSELNDSGLSFSEYGLMLSKERKDYFSSLMPLDASKNNLFRTEASASLQRQSHMESSDELSFDEYLENYFKS